MPPYLDTSTVSKMEVFRAEGADAWRRLCSDTFVPLEMVTDDGFVGQVEQIRIEGLSVSRVTCDPCRVVRSRRAILAAPRSDVLVNMVDRGLGTIRNASHGAAFGEGAAALCEADREYLLDFAAPVRVLTLQLDRSLLPITDRRLREAHTHLIPNTARLSVLRHFMTGLLAADDLGLERPAEYGAIARDLLLLALHEQDQINSATDEDSAYLMIRSSLERQHADPDLTIDGLARQHRVSRRYIESLFARHGRSPAAFLRAHRVDRARMLLIERSSITVSEAARKVGFSDVATFSRAFRRATGLPPDAWRQQQLVEGSALASPST